MKGYPVYRSVVSIVVLNEFSQSSVPYFYGTINSWSCNAGSIGCKFTTEDFWFVLGEGSWDGGLGDVPEFDWAIIWATEEQSLIVGNLALPNPIGVSHKTLLEFAVEIPHFDGFVWRTAHQKIFLSGETELKDWARVSFHCFMFAIAELGFTYTEFFQILIYRSSAHEITLLESALKSTSLTWPLCPTNLKGRIWGLKFQTSTRPSAPPDTNCFLHRDTRTFREKIQHWRLPFHVRGST